MDSEAEKANPKAVAASSPAWLQNAAVRTGAYAERAQLDVRGIAEPPAPPEPTFARLVNQRRLDQAGEGLQYQPASGSGEPTAAMRHTAVASNLAASFAPERHTVFVLGRPVIVLTRMQRV